MNDFYHNAANSRAFPPSCTPFHPLSRSPNTWYSMFHLWLHVNILFNGIQQYFRVIWSGGGYDFRTEWERTETDTDIRYSAKISTFKERWKIRIFSTFLIGDLFTTLFYVCSMLEKIDIFGIKTARSWANAFCKWKFCAHYLCVRVLCSCTSKD